MAAAGPGGRIFARVVLAPIMVAHMLAGCAGSCDYPRSFTSDGCSCFPDGTAADPDAWREHCVDHDRAYWAGGTRADRKAADEKLAAALAADGHPMAGRLTYAGTRVGGHPLLPFSWRWGYGWKYPRGYRPLSADERAALAATECPAK